MEDVRMPQGRRDVEYCNEKTTLWAYSCGGRVVTFARIVAGIVAGRVTGRDALTEAGGAAIGGFIVDLENETLKWLVSPSWKLCMPWKQKFTCHSTNNTNIQYSTDSKHARDDEWWGILCGATRRKVYLLFLSHTHNLLSMTSLHRLSTPSEWVPFCDLFQRTWMRWHCHIWQTQFSVVLPVHPAWNSKEDIAWYYMII